jgi:hypothetical protein
MEHRDGTGPMVFVKSEEDGKLVSKAYIKADEVK